MRTLKIKLLVSGALVASSLAAVSTVGIAASSATTPTCTPSLAAKPSSVININFWESMSKGLTNAGNEGALTSLVAAFNQAYAGKIHVNDINQTGGYTDTWTQYQAAIKNKTAPQVVMFDQYNTQSAYDTGTILPISACLTAAKATTKAFLKQAINSYSVGCRARGFRASAAQPRVATIAYWAREMTCSTADLTFRGHPEGRERSGGDGSDNGKPPAVRYLYDTRAYDMTSPYRTPKAFSESRGPEVGGLVQPLQTGRSRPPRWRTSPSHRCRSS